jgi:hypothetical protein
LSRNPEKNAKFQKDYSIAPGDHETYRKKALWLSSSQYLLYRGGVLHDFSKKSTENYYQGDFRPIIQRSEPVFRRMRRLIQRFQTEADDLGRSKPRLRPHRRRVKNSQHDEWVLSVLNVKKEQGATAKEICWRIGECKRGLLRLVNLTLGLTKHVYTRFMPPSTVRAMLSGSLSDQVTRVIQHSGRVGRPRYRYYLNKFCPTTGEEEDPSFTCKDCEFFIKNPARHSETDVKTYCRALEKWRSGKATPCPRFRWKIRNAFNFPRFKMTTKGVRCPRCGWHGTLRVPRFREIIICKNERCKARVWQVRKGTYRVSWKGEIPTSRIKEKDGFLVIQIFRKARNIVLEEGELLKVQRDPETKIHWLSITGVRTAAFFLDEVDTIYLAALDREKLMSGEDRTFLETETHVEIVDFSLLQALRHGERGDIAADLRVSLRELQGTSLGLELAREMVFAKIRSNLFYTMKLRRPFRVTRDGNTVRRQSILDPTATTWRPPTTRSLTPTTSARPRRMPRFPPGQLRSSLSRRDSGSRAGKPCEPPLPSWSQVPRPLTRTMPA